MKTKLHTPQPGQGARARGKAESYWEKSASSWTPLYQEGETAEIPYLVPRGGMKAVFSEKLARQEGGGGGAADSGKGYITGFLLLSQKNTCFEK